MRGVAASSANGSFYDRPAPGSAPRVVWTRGTQCHDLADVVSGGTALRARSDVAASCIEAGASLLVTRNLPSLDLCNVAVPHGFSRTETESIVAAVGGGPHSLLAVTLASAVGRQLEVPIRAVYGHQETNRNSLSRPKRRRTEARGEGHGLELGFQCGASSYERITQYKEANMSFTNWLDVVLAEIPEHSPAIIGAVLLLVVGLGIAKVLSVVFRSLAERVLSRLTMGQALASAFDTSGARAIAPRVVGSFTFWITLILFGVAAVEILGLPILTDLLGRLAAYLPNLVAAAALVIGGLAVARLARSAVSKATIVMRLEQQAEALAGLSYALVITIAVVMALEQLGLQGRVLELILAVTVGSVLAAGGLAFALGARSAVANIIAARYVTQLCRPGQEIRIDDIRGTVVDLTSTAVVIETTEGRVIVPAARFHESSPVLIGTS